MKKGYVKGVLCKNNNHTIQNIIFEPVVNLDLTFR